MSAESRPKDDPSGNEEESPGREGGAKPLGNAVLGTAYIPDFPMEEVQFWFVPDRRNVRTVFHEFIGRSIDKWGDSYYTKKGWRFAHADPEERGAEGPFRAEPGKLRPRILPMGRFFAPQPQLILGDAGEPLPIVSLEKRRPLNPWKPNYIKALNFIKKYEWPTPVSGTVQSAIWEIEECGEIAGSTSWQNAEMLIDDHMGPDVRAALVDIFEKRPEEFALGSEVYLRILGRSGPDGFRQMAEQHKNPMHRKRIHVARCLGKLRRPEGIDPILILADDEEPEVRRVALRALGRIGISPDDPRTERLRKCLEAEDYALRVWAAQALLKGGDESQRKYLISLVKEEEKRPLSDMGELGEVLAEEGIVDAVPFLITRLKGENPEIQADAAEALRAVTGLPMEFGMSDDEARRLAIREANHWWEKFKRDRRRDRDEK
jgi:hypothetical protein